MSKFCNQVCEHLSISEMVQEMMSRETGIHSHLPHICKKYDKRLEHRFAHPNLYACDECVANNDNVWKSPEDARMGLKVFGGSTCNPMVLKEHRQVRVIVASHTKKQAIETLNAHGYRVSTSEFAGYWGATGNQMELYIATEIGVWEAPMNLAPSEREYKRVPERFPNP